MESSKFFIISASIVSLFFGFLVLSPKLMGSSSSSSLHETIPPSEGPNATASETVEPQIDFSPRLEVVSWDWGHEEESNYAIAQGQVKNITNEPLENVKAIVEVYDKNKNYITHDDSLIEYTTLLPGQTSPFKVYIDWNPAIETASVNFLTFDGKVLVPKHSQD